MRFTVRVPATSANVGPGFDAFGLALDLCNEVVVDAGADVSVTWEGEGADELPTDGSDLVSRTIASVAERMQLEVPPLALQGRNRIPLGRGLGSSSAAIVTGVVIASRVLDLGILDDSADPYPVFALAAELEGHPDNVASATYGGFTVALPDGSVRRFEPHASLRPVALVPPFSLPTGEARAALAPDVPRADAVFNVAHAALVVEAITRDPSLLAVALRDRLHQDARLALVPQAADVFDDIQRMHIPVCVSGAGPTLLAFERDDLEPLTPDAIEWPGWKIVRPGIRRAGFQVADR
jgi:homoserine kinase